MSTPPKFPNTELDVTLLSTPMPKASSTVQRKSILEKKYINRKSLEETFVRPSLCGTSMLLKSDDSSLGILNNISSLLEETSGVNDKMKDDTESNKLDAEQELARKLLRKCSNIKGSTSSSDSNKEDDVSIETIRDHINFSDQVNCNSFKYNIDNKLELQNIIESNSSSIAFKMDEITARSSGMSTNERLEFPFTPKSTGGISFDTIIAEQQALQFKDEEFHSISQINSHLLADEPSWKQNYTYNPPLATNAEKENFGFSCFSGIIGELDVSVESGSGRKISIGEFFKRKSENTGNLSSNIVERSFLGIPVKSPKKKSQLIPLVDSTVVDGSSTFRVKDQTFTNATQNIEEHSIMSLSSIAQALQNIDSDCTPRRLVDQLIMAKKKRKELERNNDQGNTYMLSSSDRHSMPVTPSAVKIKDDIISSKLSLDSRTINETSETKQTLPRMLTFTSNLDLHTKDILEDIPQIISLKKEEKSSTDLQQQLNTDKIQLIDMQSILKDNKLSLSKTKSDKSGMERKESFKRENISYTSKVNSSNAQQLSTVERSSLGTSRLQDTILSKNGQEICCCIVGMLREADIELMNTGDKWIICLFNTFQLQGDKQNIIIHLPQDKILIKPNSTRSVKIGIKVTKKINPVIVILNIITSDMVTEKESIIKHMIYVESEKLQVDVLTPHEELDFGSIIENTMKTLSIKLQNKNNMVLPITLSIVHNGPKIFSINNLQDDLTHELKPREQFTAVVQCEGTSSLLTSELSQNQLVSVEAKLLIQANKTDNAVTIKEIPLFVKIGQCKIQLVDTELPIEIPKKKMKYLTIVNLGKLPLLITAFIVQDEYSSHHVEDFSIKPESLMLQRNATDKFLITFKPRHCDIRDRHVKIKLAVGNNIYYYSIIGKQNVPIEAEHENHLRCETPQQLYNAISPNSPQSIRSSRSGRSSPISSVSGSTVAGDQIPIKSTHAALVWGSIKSNKSDIKEFTIRNMSENRIKLQVHISDNNNSFLFLKDHQVTSPNIVLLLHRMESKTLSVVFRPRQVGAASGKIVFSHYEIKKEENNKSRPTKAILLYGYGGFSKIIISNIVKDIAEKMWLPLGKLSSDGILNANIKLENLGDLYSYAKVKLTPKAIYPSMLSSWQINPTEILLKPKEIQWITLQFQPKKEDLVLLQQRSNVCHVGTINIIYGDEPTRWRIRRLYSKIKNASDLNGAESEPFRNIVHPLCKIFPGEQIMSDLNLINDSIDNLSDLCHGVHQHEIMLTVETNADDSLSMMHDSADESQRFYSLYSDNSNIYESSGKSFLPSETIIGGYEVNESQQTYDDYFTVSPNVVSLIPSIKNEATVTILSSNRVAQPYETILSNTDVLSILPAEGMIPAGKEFCLKIKCKQKVQRRLEAKLEIYTANHRQDVKIKVAVVH